MLGWALRVTTNRALKTARRERLLSLRRATSVDPELLERIAAEPDRERSGALKDAFDRLSPRLRVTAVLRLQLAFGEAETAEILGCSPQTVKSNLHRARVKLVKVLGEHGFAPASIPAPGKETL